MTLILETVAAPEPLEKPMMQAIRQFDSRATLYDMTTLEQYMADAMTTDRLMSTAATMLGLFSIALMAAGLFAALHYSVAQRTRELGLRVALGATPRGIRLLVLGEALRLSAWGVPAGVALLIALNRGTRSALLAVSALDPLVFVGALTVVLAIVVVASVLPARRATRIEPMEALRAE